MPERKSKEQRERAKEHTRLDNLLNDRTIRLENPNITDSNRRKYEAEILDIKAKLSNLRGL